MIRFGCPRPNPIGHCRYGAASLSREGHAVTRNPPLRPQPAAVGVKDPVKEHAFEANVVMEVLDVAGLGHATATWACRLGAQCAEISRPCAPARAAERSHEV